MKRLRALVALLGCLAVLAGSVSVVAEATAAVRTTVDRSATDAQPCTHCDDCDGVPCPKSAVACLQACATPAVAVAVDMPVLPRMQAGSAPRPTKMGTIASPWRYDAAAGCALRPHSPG